MTAKKAVRDPPVAGVRKPPRNEPAGGWYAKNAAHSAMGIWLRRKV
jgi:hypothetical protein